MLKHVSDCTKFRSPWSVPDLCFVIFDIGLKILIEQLLSFLKLRWRLFVKLTRENVDRLVLQEICRRYLIKLIHLISKVDTYLTSFLTSHLLIVVCHSMSY